MPQGHDQRAAVGQTALMSDPAAMMGMGGLAAAAAAQQEGNHAANLAAAAGGQEDYIWTTLIPQQQAAAVMRQHLELAQHQSLINPVSILTDRQTEILSFYLCSILTDIQTN